MTSLRSWISTSSAWTWSVEAECSTTTTTTTTKYTTTNNSSVSSVSQPETLSTRFAVSSILLSPTAAYNVATMSTPPPLRPRHFYYPYVWHNVYFICNTYTAYMCVSRAASFAWHVQVAPFSWCYSTTNVSVPSTNKRTSADRWRVSHQCTTVSTSYWHLFCF